MSNERDEDTETEHTLRQLFAHAKPRPLPPAGDTEEIRRAVYAEWDAVTGRRVWFRRGGFAAAAAMLLAVAVWVGGGLNLSTPLPTIARVERVQGTVNAGGDAQLTVGGALVAGNAIATGSGQVALRLASGGSLRVGAQSEVVLTGADAAELVAGVLYFDSEDRRGGTEFTVTTELGTVRDIGTQFLVRVNGEQNALDVGVRDGRVVLTKDGDSGTAGVGERLVATQGASTIRRDAIPTFGGDWDWVERLAPPFDIDGRTVSDFLAWFAAQTGRSVVFGSPTAERMARETILSGSIDLEPQQKLSAVLALTDLTYALDAERVLIETR
jgi:ferric-dicitrate binding protein FerR (iron transport regulator)